MVSIQLHASFQLYDWACRDDADDLYKNRKLTFFRLAERSVGGRSFYFPNLFYFRTEKTIMIIVIIIAVRWRVLVSNYAVRFRLHKIAAGFLSFSLIKTIASAVTACSMY